MSEPAFDVAIIGGGAVGLACAAEIASAHRSVLLLERNPRFGAETSSRNSGVIHAGLYYPSGTYKARLCVEGRQLLYGRCRAEGIGYRRCGKLVLACDPDELPRLTALRDQGLRNGAGDLVLLDAGEVSRRAPRVRAIAALWSPETGIVDAHGLLESYAAQARRGGATLMLGTRVSGLRRDPGGGYQLDTQRPGEPAFTVAAERVVNAAGLGADRVLALLGIDPAAHGLALRYCKGDYFALSPRLGPVAEHLIYPLPERAGLGIHLTMDLGGAFSAGPDATYVGAVDYRVDGAKAAGFAAVVRRYLPELRDADLTPGYAGIRPKLHGPGEGFADFHIEEASALGLPGLVNAIGIESPGLTASAAIARRVAGLLTGSATRPGPH